MLPPLNDDHPLTSVSNVPFVTNSAPITFGVGHGIFAAGTARVSALRVTVAPEVGM